MDTSKLVEKKVCKDSSRGDGLITYEGYLESELQGLGLTSKCTSGYIGSK